MSIAQKPTKRTTTKATLRTVKPADGNAAMHDDATNGRFFVTPKPPLDLDQPIRLKPVAAEEPAPEPAKARRIVHAADMLGDHDPCHDYRLEGATAATMLVRSISPWEGAAVVLGGLDLAADELCILVQAMQSADLNEDHVAHVLAGIENRLRVIREVASRVHDAQFEEAKRAAG